MMGWQWHQLNYMQGICTSLQEITMPAPHQWDFYGPDGLPDTQPTASKHWRNIGLNNARVYMLLAQTPPLGRSLWILSSDQRGDIVGVITHTKFYVNWFRGFGVDTSKFSASPFSIGLAGRPYNSVSTTTLHCDSIYMYSVFQKRPTSISWITRWKMNRF